VAFVAAMLWLAPPVTSTEYRIGPGDVLAISVWDQKDLDQVTTVHPDGKISLLLIGEVQAGGLTVAELTSSLAALYGRKVHAAEVTVVVREVRSRSVFFVGGVVKPGPLPLTGDLTLLQAISVAGGLAPSADLEAAFVLRNNERIPVDFQRLIQKGDVSQNITLAPGDTIVVPIADVVYVQGEVRNPGLIKYSSDLTMLKAIAQAGGFTPLAASKRVTLLRSDGPSRTHLRVNVSEMMSGPEAARDVPLRPSDIIIVPQRLF
jgi:polysaccharide export outer membrane protein